MSNWKKLLEYTVDPKLTWIQKTLESKGIATFRGREAGGEYLEVRVTDWDISCKVVRAVTCIPSSHPVWEMPNVLLQGILGAMLAGHTGTLDAPDAPTHPEVLANYKAGHLAGQKAEAYKVGVKDGRENFVAPALEDC